MYFQCSNQWQLIVNIATQYLGNKNKHTATENKTTPKDPKLSENNLLCALFNTPCCNRGNSRVQGV